MQRLLFILAAMLWTTVASAEGLFAPAIEVNGDVVTRYELDQRERMLRVFNTPGDLAQKAREQLIEDRLKQQELRRAGLRLTDEALEREMTSFASRANLSLPQFVQVLKQNGVGEETLRDFVSTGVTWRDFIRQKYAGRTTVSDQDVNRALGNRASSGTAIEVLLSEIIIAAPPPRAAAAQAEARRISQLQSFSAFEAAARRVSALPSRSRGGRLDWTPLTNFPAALRPMFLQLSKGEVTDPIPIENGVALFQMRGVREVSAKSAPPAAIDYLTYALPNADPAAAQAQAARIAASVDRCDDFYGVAKGQPADRLVRESQAPAEIPGDVAAVLAGLDDNEISWGPQRAGGQTMLMVMLCSRTPNIEGGIDRGQIQTQLLGQRLAGYADALLADLKASARITNR